MDKIIELSNVKKIYGTAFKTFALNDINLTINKGEFLSIIGESGSGKSTLLNILGTLDKQTEGSYFFDGIDINSLSQKTLSAFRNEKLGFIFQFHHLMPEFTAIENVLMPYYISKKPITNEIIKKAENALDMVGVLNRKDYYPYNISGGQQQRVAIARSIINEPSLILADEPTGNLDSETTMQVYKLLKELNERLLTTFIIVTHDMHIAAMTNRIVEIKDGLITKDYVSEGKKKGDIWNEIRPCNCYIDKEQPITNTNLF